MENIEKYGVTNLFLPPTAIYVMLAHPEVAELRLLVAGVFLVCGSADVGRQAQRGH
jgi:acyl-coenzyme A synthetase/AMP-(fatty) acid ligase